MPGGCLTLFGLGGCAAGGAPAAQTAGNILCGADIAFCVHAGIQCAKNAGQKPPSIEVHLANLASEATRSAADAERDAVKAKRDAAQAYRLAKEANFRDEKANIRFRELHHISQEHQAFAARLRLKADDANRESDKWMADAAACRAAASSTGASVAPSDNTAKVGLESADTTNSD
jgi:hypothetical protein